MYLFSVMYYSLFFKTIVLPLSYAYNITINTIKENLLFMKPISFQYPNDKKQLYALVNIQLKGLIDQIPHKIANLANASALLGQALQDINWVGFYLLEDNQLILGPFQGKPACIEISVGNGVCGTAVLKDEIMLVKNVHEFPGHIACDSVSNSEIVLPSHANGKIVGVLDIDSPLLARFDEDDKNGLFEFVKILGQIF